VIGEPDLPPRTNFYVTGVQDMDMTYSTATRLIPKKSKALG
jgi:hypothetical protein